MKSFMDRKYALKILEIGKDLFYEILFRSGIKTTDRQLKRKASLQCETFDSPRAFLYIPGNYREGKLVVSKVDLATGYVRRGVFPGDGHGHEILIDEKSRKGWLIPENGRQVTEFDCNEMTYCRTISFEDRFLGGHGAVSESGQHVYFVDRGATSQNIESMLHILDIKTGHIGRRIKNVGIYAHDVCVTKDERKAIIINYGKAVNFAGSFKYADYSEETLRLFRPSLIVVDLENEKVVHEFVCSTGSILAHLVLDEGRGYVYAQGTSAAAISSKTEEEIKKITISRQRELTDEEKARDTIFLTGVLYRMSLNDYSVEKMERNAFCRTQSIVFCPKRGKIYESHAVSQKITISDAESFAVEDSIDCASHGIYDPRGVALAEGGDTIVITDRWNNIYFYDVEKKRIQKEKTLMSCNFMNSHIAVASA